MSIKNMTLQNPEIENMLQERDVVVEGELEKNMWNVDLESFFNHVVQNEGLSHPP